MMAEPVDRDLVAALESRLVNAWPSFEIELADGWLLRFAEGYSRRANSATPIVAGATLDADLVADVTAAFEARGLPACFRLTGLEDASASPLLDDLGFAELEASLAMVAPLEPALARDLSVRLAPVPKPAWVEAAASAYGGEKNEPGRLGRIVRLIRRPAVFATFDLDGEDAAWGFAVYERGYVGLYDIVVAPDFRGMGIARRLVTTLMAWGRREGAARAYLQMRETNEVADALYRSLGFETAYRYVLRVPDAAGAGRSRGDQVATTAPAAMSPQAAASGQLGSA